MVSYAARQQMTGIRKAAGIPTVLSARGFPAHAPSVTNLLALHRVYFPSGLSSSSTQITIITQKKEKSISSAGGAYLKMLFRNRPSINDVTRECKNFFLTTSLSVSLRHSKCNDNKLLVFCLLLVRHRCQIHCFSIEHFSFLWLLDKSRPVRAKLDLKQFN